MSVRASGRLPWPATTCTCRPPAANKEGSSWVGAGSSAVNWAEQASGGCLPMQKEPKESESVWEKLKALGNAGPHIVHHILLLAAD